MIKKTLTTILFALIVMGGQAKEKQIVWEQPTIEYGTSNGDGFFNLALDVTKVELKNNETVVYITAQQRSDYPDFWFQFAGDTYLKVGEQRYTITSADGIELNKHLQTNKDGKRDLAFHFPPLPKGTKIFDFIEGDGQGAFQIKGIKPAEERWKQLFPSYWRDDKGDWKIAFFEDCVIYDCKFWNYKQRDVNPKTGEATIVMTNGNDELKVAIGKNKKGQRLIQIGSEKKAIQAVEDFRFRLPRPLYGRAEVCLCRFGRTGTLHRKDSRCEQYGVLYGLAPLLRPQPVRAWQDLLLALRLQGGAPILHG